MMSLTIEKEAIVWQNKEESIRLIKIVFPGGEEKKVYKKGKYLLGLQLDFAHSKYSGKEPLWITMEYFINEKEGIEVGKEQDQMVKEITSLFEMFKRIEGMSEDSDIPIDKETDPRLN